MLKTCTLGLLLIVTLAAAFAAPAEARHRRHGSYGVLAAPLVAAALSGSSCGGYGHAPYGYGGGFPAYGSYSPYGYAPDAYGAAPYGYVSGYGYGGHPYGYYPRRRRNNVLPIVLGAAIIAAIASGR